MNILRLDAEKLAEAKGLLQALLEQPDNATTKDLVKALKNDIQAARKAGRSWGQITEALGKAGLGVSRYTLAENVAKMTKKKKDAKTTIKTGKKPVGQKAAPPIVQKAPLNPGLFEIQPDRDDL